MTDRPRILYDPDLAGFGVRVLPPSSKSREGTKTWIVEYRPGFGGRRANKKRISLGRIEVVSADDARRRAREILADVVSGVVDPATRISRARAAETLAELGPRYFAATNPFRKPRTRELYDGLWRLHVVPRLGQSRITEISKSQLQELHTSIGAKHPATANRVLILLSHFMEWCRENDLVDFSSNPARGLRKFTVAKRDRHLSPSEFRKLGLAIRKAETEGILWNPSPNKNIKHAPRPCNRRVKICPFAAAALRLLIFTGARLREILNLEWSHVDLDRGLLQLPDSKTGAKIIVLPAPAIEVLERLRKQRSKDSKARYVIEGNDVAKPRPDLQRPWKLVRDEARLENFRLHDLRHSFASVGAASNMGLPVIGALLGHSDPSTTARYAHLAIEPLRAASDGISLKIAEMLNG